MAPPPRRSVLGQFRGLIVIGVIVVVIAVGGFLLRDRLTGNAGDLKVGDCFDIPAAASATVKDVQHHPCNEAHQGEVFAVITYPGDSSATYPTQDAFDSFVVAQCGPAFTSYTGIAIEQSGNLEGSYLFPTSDGWSSGDRSVTCYLDDATGQSLTRSMRSPSP
ncbi:MAG: septum formation family protein [Candidatus Limnocylindrales bacterium]